MPAWTSGIFVMDAADRLLGAQQRNAAAGHDAFLDRGAGGVERVLDAVLLFLHFDLGRAADLDHRDAAGKLRQPFLQLLAVIVGGGLLDLCLDLADAGFDVGLLAGAVHDGGLFLLDDHLLGAAQHGRGDVLELDAEILGDQLAAGEDRDVLEHRLAAIAKARGLYRRDLEAAAQLVDHQSRNRFAFHVLGNDDEGLARLHDGFQHGKHRLQAGELLFVEEDVGILELGEHLFGIGDEVRRDVAAIELHPFDDLDLGFERLGFLDRDDALVADLLHRLRDHLADRRIAIRRDRADLSDFRGRADFLCALLDVLDHRGHRNIDAALEIHRVHAGGNRLGAFPDDRLRQHGCGGGAVAGEIVGLLGDFAHHLRAHVLELVVELDFLGDGHAILGDARGAERFVEDDIAAFRTERDLDGVGENIDAAQHPFAGIAGKFDVLGSHFKSLLEQKGTVYGVRRSRP